MKVYLFDTESGLYEGEDYWNPEEMAESEGITSIAPPTIHPGFVPIYDQRTNIWKLVSIPEFKGKGTNND